MCTCKEVIRDLDYSQSIENSWNIYERNNAINLLFEP